MVHLILLGGWFTWGLDESSLIGDAVWKTPSHPQMAESKEPSSKRLALNKWSLSFAPSSASKWSTFLGSSLQHNQKLNEFSGV